MPDKKALREKFSHIRNSIDIKESDKITKNLINSDIYENADVIFTYVSFRTEPDTYSFINKALADGKKICVPKCNPDKTMKFIQINSLSDDLASGKYGIKEPISDEATSLLPDLVVIPALSCDFNGTRLGYGGGYYDRFLKNIKKTPLAVLLYEKLISDELPKEETDIQINTIITEKRIIKIL